MLGDMGMYKSEIILFLSGYWVSIYIVINCCYVGVVNMFKFVIVLKNW